MHLTSRAKLFLLFFFSIFTIFLSPWFGSKQLFFSDIFNSTVDSNIFWRLRLPSVLFSFLVGGGLSLGGVVFQSLFRNPLSEPFIVGLSSGSAAAMALCGYFGINFIFLGLSSLLLFSFFGSFLAAFIVFIFSQLRRDFSSSLLLCGVAVNFIFSSVVIFFQYLSPPFQSARLSKSLLGSVSVVGYDKIFYLLPLLLFCFFLIYYHHQELDLSNFGDDLATSKGVSVYRFKLLMFIIVCLLTSLLTSLCGIIGFVGLMSPHICRIFFGLSHRYLIFSSFLFGGSFLVFSDLIARSLFLPDHLPVSIITSLFGGPFFLWLLLRQPILSR